MTFYTFGDRALRVPGNAFNFFYLKIQAAELLFSLTRFKSTVKAVCEAYSEICAALVFDTVIPDTNRAETFKR